MLKCLFVVMVSVVNDKVSIAASGSSEIPQWENLAMWAIWQDTGIITQFLQGLNVTSLRYRLDCLVVLFSMSQSNCRKAECRQSKKKCHLVLSYGSISLSYLLLSYTSGKRNACKTKLSIQGGSVSNLNKHMVCKHPHRVMDSSRPQVDDECEIINWWHQ